jgi:hypothetical protein
MGEHMSTVFPRAGQLGRRPHPLAQRVLDAPCSVTGTRGSCRRGVAARESRFPRAPWPRPGRARAGRVVRRIEQRSERTKAPVCRGFLQSPLTDSNRRPPPYHADPAATGRKRRQRFWRDSAVFTAARFATACHRLQPRGSIKAPSFVVNVGDTPKSLRLRSCRERATKRVASRS